MIDSFFPDPNITFPEEVEEDWTEDVQHEEPTSLIHTEVDANVLHGNTNKSPKGPNHSTSGNKRSDQETKDEAYDSLQGDRTHKSLSQMASHVSRPSSRQKKPSSRWNEDAGYLAQPPRSARKKGGSDPSLKIPLLTPYYFLHDLISNYQITA